MNKALIYLLLLFPFALHGQTYQVASVNGQAFRVADGVKSELTPRTVLKGGDYVMIAANSSLAVIDKQAGKLHALKPGKNTVTLSELIREQRQSAIGSFAGRIVEALMRGDTEKISHEANVVYKDMGQDMSVYAALIAPDPASAFPVYLTVIDETTGSVITGEASIGQRIFFRVENRSGRPLFINVLNISSDGSLFDCYPMDQGGTMLHLLTPANSIVDFRQYPLVAAEPAGNDRFILIASEVPFDLRNVIAAMEENRPAPQRPAAVGMQTLNVAIKR